MLFLYRFFVTVDVLAASVALYFFFIGLGDGSVSSFNIGIWLLLLGGISAVLLGGIALNAKGQRGGALGVLAILAAPALLAGLFLLLAVTLQPRWN